MSQRKIKLDKNVTSDPSNIYYDNSKLLDQNSKLAELSDVEVPASLTEETSLRLLRSFYQSNGGYGDMSDGNLTITNPDTVINKYTDLISDATEKSSVLYVRDASEFIEGQEILIHQTQISRGDLTNIGKYEFTRIVSKSDNEIIISTPLTRDYYSDNDGDKSSNSKTQIITVPNYNILTVNNKIVAKSWDGYSGGIVSFKAITLNGTANIDVTGKGFRGKLIVSGYYWAEGWNGLGTSTQSQTNYGGGRGRAIAGGDSWAGGGNFESGGVVGSYAIAGNAYTSIDLTNALTMGGGGSGPLYANNAGGAILCYVNAFNTYTGTLVASGENNGDGYGASGSVIVYSPSSYSKPYIVARTTGAGSAYGGAGYFQTVIPVVTITQGFILGEKVVGDYTVANDNDILTKDAVIQAIAANPSGGTPLAQDITVDTTSFNNKLSTLDADVQSALDTLDDHSHLLSELSDVSVPESIPLINNNNLLITKSELTIPYGSSSADYTVSTANEILNKYAEVINDINIGDMGIILQDASEININDEIVIHQTQCFKSLSNVGIFEFNKVVDKSGNTILLQNPIRNKYYSDIDGNKIQNSKAQITTVPSYNNLTINGSITAEAWEGHLGGIVAIRCKNLIGAGNISATGKGFRGLNSIGIGEGYDGLDGYGGGYSGTTGGGSGGCSMVGGSIGDGTGGGFIPVDNIEMQLVFGAGGAIPASYNFLNGAGIVIIYVENTSLYTGTIEAAAMDKSYAWECRGAGGSVLVYTEIGQTTTIDIAGDGLNIGDYSSDGYSLNTQPSTVNISEYGLGPKINSNYSNSDLYDILTKDGTIKAIQEYASSISNASEVPTNTSSFDGILNSNDDDVQKALDKIDDHNHTSSNINNNITNFDSILSSSDTTVQSALDTLNSHNHPSQNITVDTGAFSGILNGFDVDVQTALNTIDVHTHAGLGGNASDVATDTTSFNTILSFTDDNVQKALNTLDSHTHSDIAGTSIVSNIDMIISPFSTILYTVPTNKRFVVQQLMLITDSITTPSDMPYIILGTTSNPNEILSSTQLSASMNTVNETDIFDTISKAYSAGTNIELGVDIAGNSDVHTCTAILQGILIPA